MSSVVPAVWRKFFVLEGIQAANGDHWAMRWCWERDSCVRQRVGLGDLNLPPILGFQILCSIETEVNVKSFTGLPLRAPASGVCVPTFVFANPCPERSRLWRVSPGAAQPRKESSFCLVLHSWNSQDSSPFPPHIVNIRFSWGGQKGHFPNCICSQALIWIIQLILSWGHKLGWSLALLTGTVLI